jgi:hypothetical protein
MHRIFPDWDETSLLLLWCPKIHNRLLKNTSLDHKIPFISVTSADSRWEMAEFPIPMKAFRYHTVARTDKN